MSTKTKLIRLWCFIRGHDWVKVYSLDNAAVFGGRWQSAWGQHKCMRCGREENWQYDLI